jgi:hypothetical protein
MPYTYLYLREDGTPYYAGKGTGDRAFVRYNHNVPVPRREFIIVEEFDTDAAAFIAEQMLIAAYGRIDVGTGCLRNLTDGGDNPPNATGLKRSPETCKRMSVALTGRVGCMTDKKHSLETRQRMSLAASRVSRIGRVWSGNRRAKQEATYERRRQACLSLSESCPVID